jgi:hypothetical protein
MKENVLGGACRFMYSGYETCMKNFIWKEGRRDHLSDLDVDGRIILNGC